MRLLSPCVVSIVLLLSSKARAENPDATLVAKGSFVAPQFSPDGESLLITATRMHGIGEISLRTGTVRWLLDEARVGTHSHYRSDGTISFRAKRAGKTRTLQIDQHQKISETRELPAKVFAHRDKIYLRIDKSIMQIGSGDRFFAPLLSPDESKIAFTGLATGVHVYDIATKTQTHVGIGTAPAWSPDSKSVVFERTEDDGHTIVGSELWLWSTTSKARAFTHTPTRVERRPSWSPNGRQIAFDDNQGAIYVVSVP